MLTVDMLDESFATNMFVLEQSKGWSIRSS
jgi:hypothetical protein